MADDTVQISLVAKIGDLISGMSDASGAVKESTGQMRDELGRFAASAHEDSEKVQNELGELTESVKRFFEFEYAKEAIELLKEGLESLQEAFEGTVGKAEEFGLSNAKFAAMMGTSDEEAAGYAAALRGVGSSAQEFESMALRMQMRLNTNEEAFKKMGVATRDANGQLLGGKDLMESSIKTMQTYKEGSDQNAFALEVFGRRAADVYDIMRVSSESVQHQIDIYNEMGVQLSGTASDSEKLEEAMNDLHTMADALAIKIGQDLMPTAQAALEWMGTNGAAFAKELGAAISELAQSIAKVVSSLLHAIGGIAGAMEHLKNPTGVMDWLNAIDSLAGANGQGPLGDAIDKMQELGTGSDEASAALGHASKAWNNLMDGLSRGGGTTKEKIFGVGPESLLGEGEGTAPGDPLNEALAKQKNPYKDKSGSRPFTPPKKGTKDNTDEDAIKAEAKLGEARVAAEESTNAHLLAMDKESADQFVAQATELENRRYDIAYRALQDELALPGRTKAQIQTINEQILALQQSHEAKLVSIAQDGETKIAEASKKRVAAAHAALEEINKADDASMKAQIEHLNVLAATGQITESSRATQEQRLTDTIRQQQIARLTSEMSTLEKTNPLYAKDLEQRTKLEEEAAQNADAAWLKHFQNVEKEVRQVSTAIAGPFNTAINSMILKGQSFGDAMKEMASSVASNFITMIEQMAEEWIIQQITMAIVGKAASSTAATGQVYANTAVASTGAASAMASIPYVGPALAAAAAASMTTGLLGTYLPMASAAGGMLLDRDQLVFAHKDEQILPAHLSRGFQNIINNNGGSSSQGGNTTLHYAPTINGHAPANMESMLREDNGRTLLAFLKQAGRDGRI